jgi:hypothetical protein
MSDVPPVRKHCLFSGGGNKQEKRERVCEREFVLVLTRLVSYGCVCVRRCQHLYVPRFAFPIEACLDLVL